eukprot:jgi/Mesvir1/14338/Mv25161-RA.1
MASLASVRIATPSLGIHAPREHTLSSAQGYHVSLCQELSKYTCKNLRKTAQAIEATAACKLGSKSYMLYAKHSHPIQLALLHT